jgi:lipoate-protein ligase A
VPGLSGDGGEEEVVNYLDVTLPSLPENLALDEALLLEAEAGRSGEVLRVWEWSGWAVVMGAGCRLGEEVNEAACLAAGVPVFRRSSGGGTVLLGPGCVLYTLVLSYERALELRGIQSSYKYIFDRFRIAGWPSGIEHAGISDLAVAARKFSGNSQQRKQRYLLHHGTILYAFDLQRVEKHLRLPSRQPAYREGRSHSDFLMNLPVSAADIRAGLREAWNATAKVSSWPRELVSELTSHKYTCAKWIRRR